ncbi:MAG: hypothetical protein U1D55_02010 [Phycisphaerae bacterium]
MQIPATRLQLVGEIQSRYGYSAAESAQIVERLEGEGLIALDGSMIDIRNPTRPDSPMLVGLIYQAVGRSSGSASTDKIRDYLAQFVRLSAAQGASRRT